MALDPRVREFLEKISLPQALKFWELPLPAARFAFSSLAMLAGAAHTRIRDIRNFTMNGPGGGLALRQYIPETEEPGPLPALVFFHGGGFVFGNPDIYDNYCRLLADAGGLCVISVDYRLAPEHIFPAATEDALAATIWVTENAISLGIDAGRIAVGGDSAGGNLAAGVCLALRHTGEYKPAAQLLIAPLTHVLGLYDSRARLYDDLLLSEKAARWFMEKYLGETTDPDDPRVSPLLAEDVSGVPPAYIMLGGDDPLHDEGAAYGEKLRAAGVEVQVADYPDRMHDFSFMLAIFPDARDAVVRAARAVKTWMK